MTVKSSELVFLKTDPELTPAMQVKKAKQLQLIFGVCFIIYTTITTLLVHSLWNEEEYRFRNFDCCNQDIILKFMCLSYCGPAAILAFFCVIAIEIETRFLKKSIERTNKSTSSEDISRVEKGPPPPTYESVNLINVPPPTYQDAILLS